MTRGAHHYPEQLYPDSQRGTRGALPYLDFLREKHTAALENITSGW